MPVHIFDIELNRRDLPEKGARLSPTARAKIRGATEELYRLRRSADSDDSLIACFRLNPEIDWGSYPSQRRRIIKVLTDVRDRNPNTEQWLLYSSRHDLKAVPIVTTGIVGTERSAAIIFQARLHELSAMLISTSSLYFHNGNALFRLPTGEVSDFFLRVGNIQKDYRSLKRLFFWALPHLRLVDHILAETWSISTTAAAFAEHLAAYKEHERAVSWSYLGSYLRRDAGESYNQVRSLLADAHIKRSRLLLLVSASASGRLARSFSALCDEQRLQRASSILTIFGLRNVSYPGTMLINLSSYLQERGIRGTSGPIDRNCPIYNIDPESYFPDYRKIEVRPFTVSCIKDKSFFDRYSSSRIFRVNKQGRNSKHFPNRHHAFYIDSLALFEHPEFLISLQEKLDSTRGNVGVIHDERENASLLADKVFMLLEASGCSVSRFPIRSNAELDLNSKIHQFAADDENNLLLLIEPIFVTGSSLAETQRALRRLADKLGTSRLNFKFLIGLARPESVGKLQSISTIIGRSLQAVQKTLESAVAVEQVVLPNWDAARCPWQRELKLLIEVLHQGLDINDKEKRYVFARIGYLTSSVNEGIIESPFFKRYASDRFEFNGNSLYMDDNHTLDNLADLCCAVASAFQHWRSASKDGAAVFVALDEQTLFEPTRFNETALMAAMWRALEERELQMVEKGADFAAVCRRIFLGERGIEANFPLGLEAALLFGSDVKRALGAETATIDWPLLVRMIERS